MSRTAAKFTQAIDVAKLKAFVKALAIAAARADHADAKQESKKEKAA